LNLVCKWSHYVSISPAGSTSGEGIEPSSSTVNVLQGGSVTLSCKYNGSAAADELLWYRQYSRSRPEFLILISEAKYERKADPPVYGVSAKINEEKNGVDLKISSTAVSDSALYYCALRPTVTGNPPSTVLKL
uniref:Ig-like domain-containing protein n=1 Tax=Astyanax mexicanus TaxID=7994 RepID=A0A3B1K5Y3_ASTMX